MTVPWLPVVDKVVVPDVLIVLGLAETEMFCGALTAIAKVLLRFPYLAVIVQVPGEDPKVNWEPVKEHGPDTEHE